MARLSFERNTLLVRTVEGLHVAYEDLPTLPPELTRERVSGGDILVAALAHVTGLDEVEIIEAAVKQARKRDRSK